jgi:ADP-heptose:LPS heptosyltransferase
MFVGSWQRSKSGSCTSGKTQRILVLQFERLGDLIQSTPLLRDLRAAPADVHIDLFVVDAFASAVADLTGITVHGIPADLINELNHEVRLSLRQPETAKRAAEFLTQEHMPAYDRVINLTHSGFASWLAYRVRAQRRDGGVINREGEWLYNGDWHTFLVALIGFREQHTFNLVDLYRGEAAAPDVPSSGARPYVAVAPTHAFQRPPGLTVALNPGSSDAERRWSPANFASLADGLFRHGITPVLVGAPADRAECAAVAQACDAVVEDFSGHTTVPEMAALLADVDLLVSNDTGAVHLAAAVGTPVVGVYGVSACFRETAPWGEGHIILQAPLGHAPVDAVTPELALAACLERLGLAERGFLAQELAASSVTAWETYFLPPGADPLGGLAYRPIHPVRFDALSLFPLVMRHVLAWEFCGRRGGLSVDHLRPQALAAGSAQAESDNPSSGLAAAVQSAIHQLKVMDAAAGQGRTWLQRGNQPKLNAVVDQLNTGLAALKELANRCKLILPIVDHLDWRLRFLPPALAPADVFSRHKTEYQRSARVLDLTWSLLCKLIT